MDSAIVSVNSEDHEAYGGRRQSGGKADGDDDYED